MRLYRLACLHPACSTRWLMGYVSPESTVADCLIASVVRCSIRQETNPRPPGAYQLLPFQPRRFDQHRGSSAPSLKIKLNDQGLGTAANDKVVFAAGSDNRLRAWSLLSGERLRPDHDSNPDLVSRNSRNPLTRSFSAHPTAISITEDGMMDVGVGHAIHRFRPRRDGPSRTSDSAVRNWEASDTFM
jgi:hypothetical protein